MRKRFKSGVVLVTLCSWSVVLFGCQSDAPSVDAGSSTSTGEVADPAARAQALIESGNQAYTAGDYELAARRFGAAAVVKDDDPAAYFGLGMSLSKLGRDTDARVAYTRARRLVQEQRQAEEPESPEDAGETR